MTPPQSAGWPELGVTAPTAPGRRRADQGIAAGGAVVAGGRGTAPERTPGLLRAPLGGRALRRLMGRVRRTLEHLGIRQAGTLRRAGAMAAAVILVGLASLGSGPDAATSGRAWEEAARRQMQLEVRAGERAVLNDRITRLDRIVTFSARFGVPADLSSEIYDAAVAEGVEPELAFALVRVESSFRPRVVSSMGAVGLTQVLPSTAEWVDPEVERTELFRRGTNLRVGFRYLRGLIDRYDGDLRTALLAYNRGPTRVDSLQRRGVDPANGYARAVLELAVP